LLGGLLGASGPVANILEPVTSVASGLTDTVAPIVSTVTGAASGALAPVTDILAGATGAVAPVVDTVVNTVDHVVTPLVTEVVTPITSLVEHTLSPVTNILHGCWVEQEARAGGEEESRQNQGQATTGLSLERNRYEAQQLSNIGGRGVGGKPCRLHTPKTGRDDATYYYSNKGAAAVAEGGADTAAAAENGPAEDRLLRLRQIQRQAAGPAHRGGECELPEEPSVEQGGHRRPHRLARRPRIQPRAGATPFGIGATGAHAARRAGRTYRSHQLGHRKARVSRKPPRRATSSIAAPSSATAENGAQGDDFDGSFRSATTSKREQMTGATGLPHLIGAE
jgi:hypothetical protein